VEETNSAGAVVARYSDGLNIDEPLAMLRSAATNYYHADGLGSVTSLSNAAGALAQTYTFDSFGKQTASSGSLTNPFQYTARESDAETGLYYYRARYYDPAVGRFLSEDRLRSVSGPLNFYGYVENSTPNLLDPTGLCPSNPNGDKSKCSGAKPDPRLRLVPISDCSHKGQRRIVYELEGPDASCWWVTEHVDPKDWMPPAPALNSPEGQSTDPIPGGFDDHLAGWRGGTSTQTFTISPQDPRSAPNTPSFPVILQFPSGPNGQPQDFGTLGHYHGGLNKLHCINGNCTGWVPCRYDVPGF
jgi:RHS repeat-associated protein